MTQLKWAYLALTQDGIHEQDFASVNIRWELCVVYFSFQCLLISLYKNLANADGSAAVP